MKSISLIGTRQTNGPSSDAPTISDQDDRADHGQPVAAEAPPRSRHVGPASSTARLPTRAGRRGAQR